MNINTMKVEELKALGYDVMANIQKLQGDLQSINQQILKKQAEPKEEVVEEKKE